MYQFIIQNKKMLISYVIPCYKSENTISIVLKEIVDIMGTFDYDYEIIPVNDCSPDCVWDVLKKEAKNERIKPVSLAKNMGRNSAAMAGFSRASGDIIVLLDDDGQCPMDKIFDLIDPLFNGFDVAYARYPKKKQSRFKNWGSRINARMAASLAGKPKDLQVSNFSAMKKFVVEEIVKYKNPYPYISGLLFRTTAKITNVNMEQRERMDGHSTYTLKKLVALWLNGFTAFSVKPLRIAIIVGCLCALGGFAFLFSVILRKLLFNNILLGYSSIISTILFIGGIIMIMLGLMGEYIGRIYICINDSPQYVVSEEINHGSNSFLK